MFFEKRTGIWFVLAFALMSLYTTSIHAAQSCLAVGIPDLKGLEKFNAEYGQYDPDIVVRYENVRNAAKNHHKVTKHLDAGRNVILTITFRDEGTPVRSETITNSVRKGVLAKVIAGYYDRWLRDLAQAVQDDGRSLRLRFLHEFNGNWEQWQANYAANNPADFVPAWRHVVHVMRSETRLIEFDLNYNRASAGNLGTSDFRALYPGDEFVSSISISSYNRCGTSSRYTVPFTFEEEVLPAVRAIRSFTKKPIGIAETSTTSLCKVDKSRWIRDAFNAADKLDLSYVTWFFHEVPRGVASNDIPINWGLENTSQRQAFAESIEKLRAKRGNCDRPTPKGKSSKGYRLPYSVNVIAEHLFEEPTNDAIGPNGQPFGEVGNRIRATYTQRLRFDDGAVSHGPYTKLEVVVSDNDNQWWNKFGGVDVGYEMCRKHPSFADWGESCAFARVGRKEYFGDHPSRLDDAWEAGVGIRINFGGDLTD